MKRFLMILSLLLVCFIFAACGSSGKSIEVPDSYISSYIKQKCNEKYEDYSRMNISTEHNYDSEAHIDTVLVTLTEDGYYGSRSRQLELKYQYNKSSDLWSLFAEDEWPSLYSENCIITLYDSVIGEYIFDDEKYTNQTNFKGDFNLKILSFDSTSITVELTADGPTYDRWYSKTDNIHMEGSGTGEFGYYNCAVGIVISMTPPDGWYVKNNNLDKEYFEVGVVIDIDDGVNLIIYDNIYQK